MCTLAIVDVYAYRDLGMGSGWGLVTGDQGLGTRDQGNTDSIVVRFHSWIFIQSKESSDANSELFKEDDDEAMCKKFL